MTKTSSVIIYLFFLIAVLFLALPPAASTRPSVDRASAQQLEAIQKYIKQGWHTLTRSNAQLAKAAVDPKFHPQADSHWPVYVPGRENVKSIQPKIWSIIFSTRFRTMAGY